MAKDSVDDARYILNIQDSKLISSAKKITHESVLVHQVIYIPKVETDFSLMHQNAKNSGKSFSEFDTEENRKMIFDPSDPFQSMFHKDPEKFDPLHEVQIRILSEVPLPFDFEKMK